jgi:hypothetical protein
MGMATQVIKNQKANNVSVTGTSTMYIPVPIHNQKNQRVIFYFAIGHSLEDHPGSASVVEIIVGNPDNTEIGDRLLIPQFPNSGNE